MIIVYNNREYEYLVSVYWLSLKRRYQHIEGGQYVVYISKVVNMCGVCYNGIYMAGSKAQKVVQLLQGNRELTTKVLREAGYAESSARKLGTVKKTKTFQQLMERYLPQKHLQEKHREFLDAPRIVRTYKKGELEIETIETDSNAVKALDMAYKLRGLYAPEKHIVGDVSLGRYDEMSTEELLKLDKQYNGSTS